MLLCYLERTLGNTAVVVTHYVTQTVVFVI